MTFPNKIELRTPILNIQSRPGIPNVHGVHHWAFRCRDSEETRHFYEDILGLPLAAAVYHDHLPSSGEYQPYYHIFFEMADGSYIAFFDLLDGKAYTPDPETPAWLHHMALEVDSRQALEFAKAKLEAEGVTVQGIVPHGWFDSIYFRDPNGVRLELVHRTATLDDMRKKAESAHAVIGKRQEKIAALALRKSEA